MQLFPNPYHHLDHKNRLAGACRMGEAVRSPDAMPAWLTAGAALEVLSVTPAKGPTVQSKTDAMFIWSGEPIEIEHDIDGHYLERLRCQELFEVVGEGEVLVYSQESTRDGYKDPKRMSVLAALAAARLRALDDYRARTLKEPDESVTATWSKQFPHDTAVAEAMQAILTERAAKAKVAEDEAKAKGTDPATPAELPKRFALTPPEKPAVPTASSNTPGSSSRAAAGSDLPSGDTASSGGGSAPAAQTQTKADGQKAGKG